MGCIYIILSIACLWLQRSSHIGKRWNYCSQIIIPQNPYAAHYGSGYNSHPVRHIRLHIRLHKLEISSIVKQYFLWNSKLKTILTKLTYLLWTIYIFFSRHFVLLLTNERELFLFFTLTQFYDLHSYFSYCATLSQSKSRNVCIYYITSYWLHYFPYRSERHMLLSRKHWCPKKLFRGPGASRRALMFHRQMHQTRRRDIKRLLPKEDPLFNLSINSDLQKRAPIPDCTYFKKHPKFRSLILSAHRNNTQNDSNMLYHQEGKNDG